jgi:hypothetical protein
MQPTFAGGFLPLEKGFSFSVMAGTSPGMTLWKTLITLAER